jgi:PAP2 superfamily C-terminal
MLVSVTKKLCDFARRLSANKLTHLIQPVFTATLVICANHMYLNGFRNLGIFLHIFDIFQIIRLLATRGHYSIDIVIGWYMAIHVSNAAGRLGRHFSRGDKSLQDLLVPVSKQSAL